MSSSSSSRTSTVLTVAGVTVVGGIIAYALYFDHKRRNDVTFRKKLRKEKKKVDKRAAEAAQAAPAASGPTAPSNVAEAEIRAALDAVRAEELPPTPEEKESYFMNQVGMGEQLCAQGHTLHIPAAMCFFRALRVYPSPVELIVIYQSTVPEPVFAIVMQLMNMDVSVSSSSAAHEEKEEQPEEQQPESEDEGSPSRKPPSETSSQDWDKVKARVEGYYDYFPPKSMNVSVKSVDAPDGKGAIVRKKALVVAKDFKAGDVIYKELPVAAALDLDLEGKGTYCSHCFREIAEGTGIKAENDLLGVAYCSKECQAISKFQSQNLLFGSEAPIPTETPDQTPDENRRKAQQQFADYVKKSGKSAPLIVARLVGRQVASELAKMTKSPDVAAPSDKDLSDNADYNLNDHLERLRYLEITAPETATGLIREVLSTAVPGLEQFITDERFTVQLGKVAYNAYGVAFGGGRDGRPVSEERPEEQERTRTPYGTARQIGTALYVVSSYAQHSCDPSARPSFEQGTSELHLIATRDLKAGDEITVAYVDITQHEGETAEEAWAVVRLCEVLVWWVRAGVAKAVLAGRKLAEVARGEGRDVVEEVEDDAPGGAALDVDVELRCITIGRSLPHTLLSTVGPFFPVYRPQPAAQA
ncbi:hypothetical protein EWM64_g1472 [Hericium alpestre]|uniref:SET domain-containing protein n=1 Tax=Hericium alpestre TaxID=135208 RepID=A0A4Z0A889_9AGAM|nr:hypothetical protein EWM64_g1472 [Hericium alpestre]